MNRFVNQAELWDRYGLDYEFVLVEWNPPPDRPKLKDAIVWPEPIHGRVRIIEVSEEIHHSLPRSNRMQLYEFTGKNVGIRRAKGEFVLSTNSDILLSSKLVSFLACRKLSHKCFYRTNRYDLDRAIPPQVASVNEQLEFCEHHFTRVNLRGATIDFRNRHPNSKELNLEVLRYHINRIRRRRVGKIEDILHTNASGDFMLMSRESWNALRGHPETFISNSHLDAFMCSMAAGSGLRQVILSGPMRAYHQYHRSLDDASDLEGYALYLLWEKEARRTLDRGKPIIYNDEKWGLMDADCKETHL